MTSFVGRGFSFLYTHRDPHRCDFVAGGFLFFQPFQVDGGDVENDPFQPQDHEEALREGAVADALPIVACLQANDMKKSETSSKNCSASDWPTSRRKCFQSFSEMQPLQVSTKG